MNRLLQSFLLATLLLCGLNAAAAERTTYYIPDAQGSPVAAMDEQGNLLWRESYAPYGERRARPAGNKAANAYTGKPEDTSTGLVYMGARWYDPETGRFTGIDPQGFVEGNPQSFGRYVYANNSPYRYADPNGESPVDVLFLAYDAASFATAAYSGNPVAMWESGADLAASFVGVMSPVPGTGQMLKEFKYGGKILIGENQRRLDKLAPQHDAFTISDYLRATGQEWSQDVNDAFINLAKLSKSTIKDAGPDFKRRGRNPENPAPGSKPSDVYGRERQMTKDYKGYEKGYQRTGKTMGKELDP